MVMQVNYWSI